MVIFADGVVVHGRGEDKRPEETIIVLRTVEGERYFSGWREDVIRVVTAWVKPLNPRRVTIIGDGAQWIREGLYSNIAGLGYDTLLILDWYHLRKKITELLSMVCNGKKHRNEVMAEIQPLLWEGKVDEAIERLRVLLPEPRNHKKFNELISYLEARKPIIQDYDTRKRSFEYNGNGIVEKANDLLVARRQKAAWMSWSRKGSDTLCALTTLSTLWYNREWDRYWVSRTAA